MAIHKKEECVIHVGMHKTGSSSIQATLFDNLQDSFYGYLKLRKDYSVLVYTIFQGYPLHPSLMKKGVSKESAELLRKKWKKKLVEAIQGDSHQKIIISGEGITAINADGLAELKSVLRKYFNNVRIIAYIREPISYIESHFQQKIKGGYCSFGLKDSYPNYKAKFDKFYNVFGEENISLYNYNLKTIKEGNVVIDFLYRIGIDICSDRVINTNYSLSHEALVILYYYRKYYKDSLNKSSYRNLSQLLVQ